jgi:uncharacterized glyoxalase superfamily protein PhnB
MSKFHGRAWSLRYPRSWQASYDDVAASFVGPSDIGALQISSIRKKTGAATDEDLLEMAARHGDRADIRAVTLGDFGGFSTRREEDGLAWTWWWLRRGSLVLAVTYSCDPLHDGEEAGVVEDILSTLESHDKSGSSQEAGPPPPSRAKTMRMWKEHDRATELMRCSFCNKSQLEVQKMIAARSAYICDGCVTTCVEILTDEVDGAPSSGEDAAMPSIITAAPQFLVDKLTDSLAFYEQRLGFTRDFVYEGFYASVSRDGAVIHLKCAPKLGAERAHRKSGEHLDAFLVVSGIEDVFQELVDRGAPITRPLERMPWGTRDFLVEDPDGYILCFSEAD